jgi:YegS/Rv2252/BmrU family lipid kinase
MPPVLMIYNAAAGSADDPTRAAALATLREHATEVADASVEHPDEIAGVLARYPAHQPVAAGGDGTVHSVVAALVERGEAADRTVGLIPLGTGNDLARTLGLPTDPAEAARVAVTGTERALDLLVDDTGWIALNAVHLGVGAEASRLATPLKPVLRMFAYRVGGLLAGVVARGWRVRVEVDGEPVAVGRRRVLMVAISNGRTIGGGTPLAPEASPGDGRADVLVSFAVGPVQRLTYGLRLRRGDHIRHRQVTTLRGKAISITVRDGHMPINVDGELGEPVSHHSWRVEPGAWRIRTN